MKLQQLHEATYHGNAYSKEAVEHYIEEIAKQYVLHVSDTENLPSYVDENDYTIEDYIDDLVHDISGKVNNEMRKILGIQ